LGARGRASAVAATTIHISTITVAITIAVAIVAASLARSITVTRPVSRCPARITALAAILAAEAIVARCVRGRCNAAGVAIN